MKSKTLYQRLSISLLAIVPIIAAPAPINVNSAVSPSTPRAKHTTRRLSNNFSIASMPKTGADYCIQEQNVTKNCFPFQNTSSTVYINISFSDGILHGLPMQRMRSFHLTQYTKSISAAIFNSANNNKIYDGPVQDMVGLTCDGDQCRPWK